MIKAAIFDFDGTLFDSMFIWERLGEDYIKSRGFVPEEDLRKKFLTMSLHQAAEYFREKYVKDDAAEDIEKGINSMAEKYYFSEILPKKGAEDFLKELKKRGIKMCIATATDRYLIEKALERCSLSSYFDEIFTCGALGTTKNSPYIYRKALEFLGSSREDTMVFEDALYAASTAKKDGFTVTGIDDIWEKNTGELINICDYYIYTYEDTEKYISLVL